MFQLWRSDETGEISTFDINKETGEHYLQHKGTANIEIRSNISLITPKGSKKFQRSRAKILAKNKISHRMLLIPTVMIFPGMVCLFLAILEIFLHVRCHKNNSEKPNSNTYYQSPFHAVTSVFCGVCREFDATSKINQIQEKRRNRYDYIRRIAI